MSRIQQLNFVLSAVTKQAIVGDESERKVDSPGNGLLPCMHMKRASLGERNFFSTTAHVVNIYIYMILVCYILWTFLLT